MSEKNNDKKPKWLKDADKNYAAFWHIHNKMNMAQNILTLPSLSIAFYLGVGGVAGITEKISTGILGLTMTILITLTKYFRYAEKAEACSVLSKTFLSILKEYDAVSTNNDEIPPEILEKLKNRYLSTEAQGAMLPIEIVSAVDNFVERRYGTDSSLVEKRNITRRTRLISRNNRRDIEDNEPTLTRRRSMRNNANANANASENGRGRALSRRDSQRKVPVVESDSEDLGLSENSDDGDVESQK